MTTTRLLLAAGFTVAAALSLSGTREPPPPAERPAPPTDPAIAIALFDAPATPAEPIVAEIAPPPAPPRWPDEWPSLDPVPGNTSSATQTMASGEIDVYLDGNSTFEISDDPARGQPADDGDDGDDLDATDEGLDRLGDMFHAERYGEEEAEAGEKEEERRPVSVLDEFEERPDIAEARKRRDDARERAQAEEEEKLNRELEDLDLTDEERAARDEQRKREEEEYRELISEVDAEIEQGGGLFQTPPPPPESEAGDETAPERPTQHVAPEAQPPAPPATGYRFTTSDGEPVNRVVVGQSFNVELRVTPEQASIPGRAGGRRELDFIEATLISEGGEEQTIRLWRADEPSEDGLIRFVSREPISIAARVNGNPQPGTIGDLDLDLRGPDDQLIETIRIRSGQNVTGGFTTIELFGKPITAALDEVKDAIDVVEEYLRGERQVAERLVEDAQEEEVVRATREWLERIDDQLRVLDTARRLAENEYNEEYKLVLSSRLLQTVIKEGPNGWEISELNPLRNPGTGTVRTTEDILRMERKTLDERYRGRAIVQQAAFDLITPYLVTSYSQFAHITMGAPVVTLVYGVDEFGNEASRGWALVEIGVGVGIAVVAVKLPATIHSYIDEGRLVPSNDLEFITSPTRPRRPGQIAERTRAHRDHGAVYQDAPYRRLPGETATPTPGVPGGRSGGLTVEEALLWRQRENPQTQQRIQETNELISRMDESVRIARDRGVPDDVIDGILSDARLVDPETGPVHKSLEAAQGFVASRLEWEIAVRNRNRILISESTKQELEFYANLPEASATPQHLAHAEVVDMVRVETVISKARLWAKGEPPGLTPGEIRYGRTLERRLEAGEDLSGTKTITDAEDVYGPGLRPVFTPEDLVNIRTMFDGRPLKIIPETSARPRNRPGQNRPPPEPDPSDAPTVSPDAPTQRIEGRDPTERIAPGEQLDPSEAPTVSPDAPTQRIEGRAPTERITPVSRVVNPVTDPVLLGGPSGQGGPRSAIEVVFRGLGGSQGAVMEAFFVNWGEDDVHIDGEAVAFEPVDELDPDAQDRYDELMDAFSSGKRPPPPPLVVGLRAGPAPLPREWQGANVVRVVLDAYCLEFAAGVPTEGTIFRIADREKQQANARFRAIIAASRHLRDAGELHPDTDPDAYFHSIRQWAIWVEELDLDREGYEETIVEHTRKNFEAAGRRWTEEADRLVRRLVPNRWRDITAILTRADRLESAA